MILLSGPFGITDSMGRTWQVNGIRIFDEGYAIIDVYVDLASSMEDEPLYEDPIVIGQIMARLRAVGYLGPDFGHGDPGLQDDKLIVLEAPEVFSRFAASRGWRNLADDYDDEHGDDEEGLAASADVITDPLAQAVFAELMRKVSAKPGR